MRFARLFDGRDEADNPVFAPDRPRIGDPAERDRVAAFLRAGKVIRRTTGRTTDRLDPARGKQVPMSTHTDGTWIWNAGVRYYLETYGIAPEPEFLAHIAASGYEAVTPEEPAWREALEALRARG